MPRDRSNGPGHGHRTTDRPKGVTVTTDSKTRSAPSARRGTRLGAQRRARMTAIDPDRAWAPRSLCRNDLRFSDGPFGTSGDAIMLARQLAHRCRAHCPVVEWCAAEVIGQAPARPRMEVRAGVYFPDKGKPRVLDDTGCGPHCAGLPAVHRKAVAR